MKTLARAILLALAASLTLSLGVAVNAPIANASTTHTSYVTLNSTADAFVSRAHPWRHYGSWSSLRIGGHHASKRRAYVRFAIPSQYAGKVTGAELVLARTTHHFPRARISASATSASWYEHYINANNAPRLGELLDTRWVKYSRTHVTLNVTRAVVGHSKVSIALTSKVRHDIAIVKSRAWYAGPKLVLTVVTKSSSTSNDPPVTTPPSTTPPSTTPPTSTPPTTTPPTSTPPTTTPPTSTPPTTTPPTSTPPTTTPPTSTPPTTTPPTSTPPTTTPPTTPPTSTPPTTTPPTTPPTSTPPTTTPPTSTPPSNCTVTAKLVNPCRVWFGDTPQAYTHSLFTPSSRLSMEEAFTGRKFDILHEYSVNAKLFPTAASIQLADQGRILSENWKPGMDMSWADVAAGRADDRIDAEAAYLKANFNRPFFLSIYHEPEDNVGSGPGMTTSDYVAMYRHTIQRLRAKGATMFITVMNYMGYTRWDGMRDQLYPGDDVVDWIAYDPYMFNPGNTSSNDFAALVNGPNTGHFYTWATTTHPGKPLMIAEWGAYDDKLASNPLGMAQFYGTIANEIGRFPALKALDHFTMNPIDVAKGSGTSPTETAAGLLAWQLMAKAPIFNGK